MREVAGTVLDELSRKVAVSDDAGRDTMLVRLSELFAGVSHLLDDAGIETFDAIFLSLTPVCGVNALETLSNTIAENPRAPRRSIRRLAFDDEIMVARPVITLSPLLLDEDQLALATVKGPDHLLALCERHTLTSGVTDIILSRANGRIRVALARNGGARLSDRGLERLADAALEDDELHDALKGRDDLLGSGAATAPPAPPSAIQVQPGGLRYHATMQVEEVEARILALLERSEVDEALGALAESLRVPSMPVAKAFALDIHGGFLAYARAAGLGWDTTERYIKSRYAAGGVVQRLQRAKRDFESLKQGDARRVVALLVKHAPAGNH